MDIINNIVRVVSKYWNLFLIGTGNTLLLSAITVLFGVIIGSLLALMRISKWKIGSCRPLNLVATIYVEIIRGTPLLLQLYFFYFLLPMIIPALQLDKSFSIILALCLNSGAYVAEIIRAGISAVDKGQMEAGRSLGLNYAATMRFVIIPQAIKNILPALGNELITLLKETSVVTVIGLKDLTKGAMIIQSKTYQAFVPYIAIAVIYLVMVLFLSWVLGKLERRMRQSDLR